MTLVVCFEFTLGIQDFHLEMSSVDLFSLILFGAGWALTVYRLQPFFTRRRFVWIFPGRCCFSARSSPTRKFHICFLDLFSLPLQSFVHHINFFILLFQILGEFLNPNLLFMIPIQYFNNLAIALFIYSYQPILDSLLTRVFFFQLLNFLLLDFPYSLSPSTALEVRRSNSVLLISYYS